MKFNLTHFVPISFLSSLRKTAFVFSQVGPRFLRYLGFTFLLLVLVIVSERGAGAGVVEGWAAWKG
jgi:hypothetical protein